MQLHEGKRGPDEDRRDLGEWALEEGGACVRAWRKAGAAGVRCEMGSAQRAKGWGRTRQGRVTAPPLSPHPPRLAWKSLAKSAASGALGNCTSTCVTPARGCREAGRVWLESRGGGGPGGGVGARRGRTALACVCVHAMV